MRTARLDLPVVTPLLNTSLRSHWSKRRKKRLALAWAVRVAAGNSLFHHPATRARVRIERRSVGTPDHDGFVGGLKDLLDVLQPFVEKRRPYGLGFIASDAPSCLTLEPVAVRVRTLAEQGTTIIIEELP